MIWHLMFKVDILMVIEKLSFFINIKIPIAIAANAAKLMILPVVFICCLIV